jgi:hypothetical protein
MTTLCCLIWDSPNLEGQVPVFISARERVVKLSPGYMIYWNSSAVALRVVGGDEMGTHCPGVCLAHPVPGGYEYRDQALQVGGVSDETVKYGYGSCATLSSEWLQCKVQIRPLVREGALHEEAVSCQTTENLKSKWTSRVLQSLSKYYSKRLFVRHSIHTLSPW